MNETTYQCPLCKSHLTSVRGTQTNPAEGFTLFCRDVACPAQEVSGHAKDEKGAYEIVLLKFKERS